MFAGATLVAGCAVSPSGPLRYQFVDAPAPTAGAPRVFANATAVAGAVDIAALEPDVRHLASPELRGRLRGTEGNARAREYIVGSSAKEKRPS